jgi:CheY-like chemotaxis protein
VTIPQAIADASPCAAVNSPETKRVMILEHRGNYSKALSSALKDLSIRHRAFSKPEEALEALETETYSHIIVSSYLYRLIQDSLNQKVPDVPLAVITDEIHARVSGRIRYLPQPAYSVLLADFLNDEKDNRAVPRQQTDVEGFIAPEARILLVDDMETNLLVAEGLLSPYGMTIDLCRSGAEAVLMASNTHYDLIFMDHMMPGMDGVEATKAIRALNGEGYKTVPIVALTANAVTGMREMFLENGFNDFVSKPIDLACLEGVLSRWLPEEKIKEGRLESPESAKGLSGATENFDQAKAEDDSRLTDKAYQTVEEMTEDKSKFGLEDFYGQEKFPNPMLCGIDLEAGLSRTRGKRDAYQKILQFYLKDAADGQATIEKALLATDYKSFTISVHALKSASAAVGALPLSEKAAALEQAGRGQDQAFIQANIQSFKDELAKVVDTINHWLKTGSSALREDFPIRQDTDEASSKLTAAISSHSALKAAIGPGSSLKEDNFGEIINDFYLLKSAFDSTDTRGIDTYLTKLREETIGSGLVKILDTLEGHYLNVEYEEACSLIDELLERQVR